MTFDEAVEALKARAPSKEEMLAGSKATAPDAEYAYQLMKWAKKNCTDEELAALGVGR